MLKSLNWNKVRNRSIVAMVSLVVLAAILNLSASQAAYNWIALAVLVAIILMLAYLVRTSKWYIAWKKKRAEAKPETIRKDAKWTPVGIVIALLFATACLAVIVEAISEKTANSRDHYRSQITQETSHEGWPNNVPSNATKVSVTKESWTFLPEAHGDFHFELQNASVKCLIECINILPDDTAQVVDVCEFGGDAGLDVKFPNCKKIAMKTINTAKTNVYYWTE